MVSSHKNTYADVRGTCTNVGLLACRDGRTRAPGSPLMFFADLFRVFLSSAVLFSLPTVLAFRLLTSFFALSPSIRLIAKQQ